VTTVHVTGNVLNMQYNKNKKLFTSTSEEAHLWPGKLATVILFLMKKTEKLHLHENKDLEFSRLIKFRDLIM